MQWNVKTTATDTVSFIEEEKRSFFTAISDADFVYKRQIVKPISYAITSNLQVAKLMTEKYGLKLSEARHTDASEGYNTDPTLGNTDQVISEDFLNSRY